MPYIAIKSFPKDDATKNAIADKINETFLDIWGCPPEAITVSFEEVEPADWQDKVVKTEIEPYPEKMKIVSGQKKY